MRCVHPNLSCPIIGALIAIALVGGGCRSSSSGIAGSPFLAPDRVPPPSTRALLPGQAQPYYQGDPLPAMQSAARPPAGAVAAIPNDADARSSSGRTLPWASPGSSPPPAASPTPSAPIAAANEASVAVPADADPLRFPMPAPREAANDVPIATAKPPAAPPMQPQAPPLNQAVLPVSYNQPAPTIPPTVTTAPTPPIPPASAPASAPPQQSSSPWRSPQIAPSISAAVQPIGAAPLALPAPPSLPMQPPVAAEANSMGVTLRRRIAATRTRRPDAASSPARLHRNRASRRRRWFPPTHQHAIAQLAACGLAWRIPTGRAYLESAVLIAAIRSSAV